VEQAVVEVRLVERPRKPDEADGLRIAEVERLCLGRANLCIADRSGMFEAERKGEVESCSHSQCQRRIAFPGASLDQQVMLLSASGGGEGPLREVGNDGRSPENEKREVEGRRIEQGIGEASERDAE